MGFLSRLFGSKMKPDGREARRRRIQRIQKLGFILVDKSEWRDGGRMPRRYYLERNGQSIGGPYESSRAALHAAEAIAKHGTEADPAKLNPAPQQSSG